MASNLLGYEDLVECPYNRAHQILRSRIQTHLVRCRKSHPDIHLEICPFNSTHLMKKEDKDEHVRACPDRASLERYVYSIGQQPAAAAVAVVQPPQPPAPPRQEQEEENWDDVNEPTYNPQDYVQRAPVLRTLNCAPPAQRKAFREAERLRLNNLK